MNWIKDTYGFLRGYSIYKKKISFPEFAKFKKNLNKEAFIEKDRYIGIKAKQLKYPFFCRAGSSDFKIFRDFFLKSDYADANIIPSKIIDGGANIGAFTVLFKRKYPHCHIVAIEPDEDNCKLFKRNTDHLANVELIKGGLASKSGRKLRISNPDHAEYSYITEFAVEGVPSISIQEIMKMKKWEEIDIVKIDIEGAEKELLSDNIEWIKRTKVIIIEVHDYKVEGCSNALVNALQNIDCSIGFSGENLVIYNNQAI